MLGVVLSEYSNSAEGYEPTNDIRGPILDEIETDTNGRPWLHLNIVNTPSAKAEQIVLTAVAIEICILNEAFRPEFEVTVNFGNCGEANAYYDPNQAEITICAELAGLFTK